MTIETEKQINEYYDKLIQFLSPEELEYDCKLNKGLAEYCKTNQDVQYFKFVENATPEDLKSRFYKDKLWKNYYLLNKDVICKKMLQKYEVDYTDEDNLVYRYVHLDTYYDSSTCRYNFPKIYRLFLEYYEMEELDCSNEGITSIPRLPKMKKLYCNDNELRFLPVLESLEELNCLNNRFVEFPGISNIQKQELLWRLLMEQGSAFFKRDSGFPNLKLFNGSDDYAAQLYKQCERLVRYESSLLKK